APSTNNQLVSIIYLSPVANLFLKFRKYYFINNLKNSCIQPTHDGEMLDKEAKLTRKLNSQFDKYTNVITPTFPYYMLKKFERGE
ncbi:hypothetical protein, partial [Limosilactobacillus reuteri]|uniref:hypothetical protein n=1 Tax=Limosilactobacillus reuteri TaxID=1598 RepID=UPI00232AE21D